MKDQWKMPMGFVKQDNLAALAGSLTGVDVAPIDLDEAFVDLAARFAHLPGTVVLLSGGDLDCARYHILGILPWLTLWGRPGQMRLRVDDQEIEIGGDPFEALRLILGQFRLPPGQWPEPLAAGLMGYLAYDLKDNLETLPRTGVDDLHLPHILFYAPSVLVVHDRHRQTTRLMVPQRAAANTGTEEVVARFQELRTAPTKRPSGFRADADAMLSNFNQEDYKACVGKIIDYIAAGDVYQVNLSQRFQVPFEGDSFGLFQHLFAQNPAPFFSFVQAGDHQIVSTSPERFLLRSGSRVETRPIKGTRPRGRTPQEDRAWREELTASAKDGAELSMIVDLLRNDIGKACAAGSVRVKEHKRLEAYQNVYHLVSIVEGDLDEGRDSVDLLQATFPGGSITGCPKVRAMEIIDELESCRRHVYCGSIGYLSFHDSMDFSIAIRTATIVNDSMLFSVGGAVVFDSDPQSEYEETLHKGQTLMSACQSGDGQGHPDAVVWHDGRLKPAKKATISMEDQGLLYGFGFFETLRTDSGHAPLLAEHLARFAHTWRALMPGEPPDLTWKEIITQVVSANLLDKGCAAVKILATRGSRNAPPWDHALLVTARPYTHRLADLQIEGLNLGTYPHPRQSPLAEHKTLNYLYYLQAGHWARDNGFNEALILNPDGSVSETNTTNLLLINGREVIRPQSPFVLPGVMAQAVCRLLTDWGYTIVQQPVRPEAIFNAGQVLAANALMGAAPVVSLNGHPRPNGDDLWMRINDTLIPGWRI